jgi:hypothetical protein
MVQYRIQGFTIPGRLVAVGSKFSAEVPNVCGCSFWNLLHAYILAPRIFEVTPRIWGKLCIPGLS